MINLMPDDLKQDIRYARMNVSMIQYVILVAIISVALTIFMFAGILLVQADENLLRQAIADKETQLAELKTPENDAKELASRISLISSLLNQEVEFSKLIQDIGSVIPSNSRLNSLSLTGDDGSVSLTIIIPEQADAPIVRETLASAELFTGADIISIGPSATDEDGNVLDYAVVVVVRFFDDSPPPPPSEEDAGGGSEGSPTDEGANG